MTEKQYSTLDHVKRYIDFTQRAKIALEKGDKQAYKKYFDLAESHLNQAGWESLIIPHPIEVGDTQNDG